MNKLTSFLSLTLAALSISAVFLLSLSEIIARNIFGTSIDLAQEYMGYLVASAFIMGSGWTLSQDGHIRISIVSDYLSPQLRFVLNIWVHLLGLGLSLYLARAMGLYAWESFLGSETSYFPSATALVWPQSLLALGFLLLALSFISAFMKSIRGGEG